MTVKTYQDKTPVVTIVGRPNVGKSLLCNRIAGKRAAVVDDMSGVTRDRNYVDAEWDGLHFLITDTGGLVPPGEDDGMTEHIRRQVDVAVEDSDAIVFLTDILCGPTVLDEFIAKRLHRGAAEKVILAANKAESPTSRYEAGPFMALGFGEPLLVSALHGHGTAALLDRACDMMRKARPSAAGVSRSAPSMRIAVLGRPNAGKSSIVNKLLGSERMIVHSVAGTTRDAIDSRLTWHDRDIVIIDTAGLRKKAHVEERVEYYANLRALESMQRADVCVLVIDAVEGVGEQDTRILRQIVDAHRGVVCCLNKWDLVEKDHRTFDQMAKYLRATYMQLRHVPILSTSALTGQRVSAVLDEAAAVHERMHKRVPVSQFQRALQGWVRENPHPLVSGRTVRIFGGKQVHAPWPLFHVFVSSPELVKPSYERFVTNQVQEEFDFSGCPLEFVFKPPAAPRRHGRPAAVAQGESA